MTWNRVDLLRHRTAVLANGGQMPLSDAVAWFDRLAIASGADEMEWEPLFHLRALALGSPLDPQPVRAFVREGLLNPDGTLDAGFRDVILSAVRGEDRALYLESPFTDPLDRALADFVRAREVIAAAADLGQLDRDTVASFLGPDRFERALDALANPPDDAGPLATDPPLPDPKTFAEQVLRRARPPVNLDDKTPPPPK